ncbi:MAG TPA: hypothetical protein DIW17_06190 [Clostridiales bacterium]|nr:zinc ribbon domain-containing protein [Clostridia bacterium]HCS73447.1 hypothetical protein [Clostridiales bacterium]
MAFFEKMKDKTSDMLEISKLNGKIKDEKAKIAANMSKIAEYYWAKFESGEALDSEATTYCSAILESKNAITEFNQEIVRIKEEPQQAAETPAQQETATEPAPIQPPSGVPVVETVEKAVICSGCGTKLQSDKKFCSDCGTPIPPPQAIVEKPTIQAESKPSYCTSCGKQLAAGKKFCAQCGAPVPVK